MSLWRLYVTKIRFCNFNSNHEKLSKTSNRGQNPNFDEVFGNCDRGDLLLDEAVAGLIR